MSLHLRRLVPEGYDRWYYHEESGLLLHNNFEYGWCATTSLEMAHNELGELDEAINAIASDGGTLADTSEILPLPDDYEHALPPRWKR